MKASSWHVSGVNSRYIALLFQWAGLLLVLAIALPVLSLGSTTSTLPLNPLPGRVQPAILLPDSTAIGDTLGDDTVPAVDFGSSSYLVAWSYLLDSPKQYGILGRLVDTAGNNLSAVFGISLDTTKKRLAPDVAYNAGGDPRYLVVWEQEYTSSDHDIYARLVRPDGVVVGSELPISTSGNMEQNPAVAANPNAGGWLVVWQMTVDIDEYIYAQRVDASGALLGSRITITNNDNTNQMSGVAFNPLTNRYLVVWQRTTGSTSTIFGRLLDAEGNPVTEEMRLSGAADDMPGVDVASRPGSSDFMVVWSQQMTSASDCAIFARRIDSEGGMWDAPIPVSSGGEERRINPAVASSAYPSEYMVAWEQSDAGGNQHIQRRRMLRDGSFPEPERLASDGVYEHHPAIAADQAVNYLVVWDDQRDFATQRFNIYGSLQPIPVLAGHVFSSPSGEIRPPLPGVTVSLYCSADPGLAGDLMAARLTDSGGRFEFIVIRWCAYYQLVESDPPGFTSTSAYSASGTVVNPNWIRFDLPLEDKILDANSFFDQPLPPTLTLTATTSATASNTATITSTPTLTSTATLTLTPTLTATASRSTTPSITPTVTVTASATKTYTVTPTRTLTLTPTRTNTQTLTPTLTATASITSTATVTATSTRTATRTVTPTRTVTRTATLTATASKTPSPTPTLPPIVWIYFDDYSNGTHISEQYASLGVHFLSDYMSWGPYRTDPKITASTHAHSSPNVLVNGYSNLEFYSSINIPMMFWFDNPVSKVGMQLTSIANADSTCAAVTATVKVYDCAGNLIDSRTVTVSALSFTPLEIDDSNGKIYKVVVDYGSSSCAESIDDLAFQPAQPGVCYDLVAPSVSITLPTSGSTLTDPAQTFQATIKSGGIIQSVLYNGAAMPYYLTSSGDYKVSRPVTFSQGSNTVVLAAYNYTGFMGTATAGYTVGVPTTAALKETHLTQRGVIMPKNCDIDSPLVAGKSTLLRIKLDVRTASNAVTYASYIDLKLYKWDVTGDILIDTIGGYPYPSMPVGGDFTSSSQMNEILFDIPGTDVAQEGSYRLVIQPYTGINPLGAAQTLNCGGYNYQFFNKTRPVKLLLVPVEAGAGSTALQNTNHVTYLYHQLETVGRALPVADLEGASTGGVQFGQTAPFHLCDGTSASQAQYPTICKGTGFTWKFIDKDSSGILQRADGVTVTDKSQSFCDSNDHTVGGKILSSKLYSYSFNPNLGIFRPGIHPGWQGAKYAIPVDENHNGVIDSTEMSWYIASFFDSVSSQWLQFPSPLYYMGETIRFFMDKNNNKCNDPASDTQAPIRQKFDNMQNIFWEPQNNALNAANNAISGTSDDYTNAILIFPTDLIVSDSLFGDVGPGQGQKPGRLVWNHLIDDTTWAHELGHNIGNVYDRYYDNIPDDIQTTEGASYVYINGVRWPAYQVYAIMGVSVPYDKGIHAKSDYLAIYNTLVKPLNQVQVSESDAPVFYMSGAVDSAGQLLDLSTSVLTGVAETPTDPTSNYALVFGAGTTELKTTLFAVGVDAPPPEGYSSYQANRLLFDVVSLLPDGTQWVELRHSGAVLAHVDKTAHAPQVWLLSPVGGEDFAADAVMPITWNASDQDGGNLLFTVEYSPDGGASWITVASPVAGNSYQLNLADVPGTNPSGGLVRVTASDGFNQGQAQNSATFRVGAKPPLVSITTPAAGQNLLQCNKVHLQGEAYHPEGGNLSYQWMVDGQSVADAAQAWAGPFDPGAHQVTFRAEDAAHLASQAQASFTVLADSDCDGMPDAFEDKYNLNPLYMDDANLDNDHDGLTNLQEYGFGTDPTNPDTDGDGFTDGIEIALGTNPLDPSSHPQFKVLLPLISKP